MIGKQVGKKKISKEKNISKQLTFFPVQLMNNKI
jgi:hypothetical protein